MKGGTNHIPNLGREPKQNLASSSFASVVPKRERNLEDRGSDGWNMAEIPHRNVSAHELLLTSLLLYLAPFFAILNCQSIPPPNVSVILSLKA